MKPVIRCIIQSAVYQICYMDAVPDSAACNEAVRLAKRKGFQNLSGFVNGVLRTIVRSRTQVVWPDQGGKAPGNESVSAVFCTRMDDFHVGGRIFL